MKIDNNKQVALLSLVLPLLIVGILITIGISYFSDIINDNRIPIILLAALAIVLFLYRYGGLEYIAVEFEDNKIDIKYYRLFPIGRKFRRVIISFESLGKFEIKNGFMGLFSKLILYQNKKGGQAKYPPIGIAATSSTMRTLLAQRLTQILS